MAPLNFIINCLLRVEEKRDAESFDSLVHILDVIHIDNMKILKALINTKDDILPLYDGSDKERVCNTIHDSFYKQLIHHH